MTTSPQGEDLGPAVFGRRPVLKFLFGFSIFATMAGVLTPIMAYLAPPPTGSAGGGGRVRITSANAAQEMAAEKLGENLFHRLSSMVAVVIILLIIATLSILKRELNRQLKTAELDTD